MAHAQSESPLQLDAETAHRLFREMVLIRRFEERTEEQYTRARIGGYCHLAIGEEASVVGAIDAMQEGDCVFASYRDHGTAMAVGSPPGAVMAELFGKVTGSAHGRGGSMHLLDVERRFYGGWGIVGAHLPIAAGAALALEHTEQPNAVLCQFGDGAVATGAFHEALNLAAVWKLPDRLSGDQQPVRHGHLGRAVGRRARPVEACRRIPHARRADRRQRPDGGARSASSRLLEAARSERKPALLETVTYRFRGHSVADAGKVYRSAEEIESWKQRDPITRFGLVAAEQGLLTDADIEEVWREVNEVVKRAIDEALTAADPDRDSLYEHLYGDPASDRAVSANACRSPVR